MLQRAVEILQPEPRLGNHPFQLGSALRNGLPGQFFAVLHDVAVVALAEFDLKQVIGTPAPRRHRFLSAPRTLLGRHSALGIVDIGEVIACMVGIFAAAADPVEMFIGRL